MLQRRSREAGDLAREELTALAAEWGVKPLTDEQMRSYTSCLAQHHRDDLRSAFAETRRRGARGTNLHMPMVFLIVRRVRDAYRERTSKAKRTVHTEVAA